MKTRLYAFATIAIVATIFAASYMILTKDYVEIQRINLNVNLKVLIYIDNKLDTAHTAFYELVKNGRRVTDKVYIGTLKSGSPNKVLLLEGDQIFGLAWDDDPEGICAVFDVTNGDIWPASGEDVENNINRDRLIERLRSRASRPKL
jgi:hypothetical protein